MPQNEVFYTLARREEDGWHFLQSPGEYGTVDECETPEEAQRMAEVLSDDLDILRSGLKIVRVEVVAAVRT
jgi:hypothetical protein